jgi:hypothetical protein
MPHSFPDKITITFSLSLSLLYSQSNKIKICGRLKYQKKNKKMKKERKEHRSVKENFDIFPGETTSQMVDRFSCSIAGYVQFLVM